MRVLQHILLLLTTLQIALSLFVPSPENALTLVKRKGGGGGGRGGSSGGSSSSSGSSGSSGSTGGSSSSSGSRGTGSSGSSGGTSSPKAFGGRYSGGSSSSYAAGARSPRGITPRLLPIAALGFFPGLWLAGAYAYSYPRPYYYRDDNNGGRNTSLPVLCLCQENSPCGCDDDDDTTYVNSLSSNGSIQGLNGDIAKVVDVNGTRTLVINGTLAADGSTSAAGHSYSRNMLENAGFWFPVAVILYSVLGL